MTNQHPPALLSLLEGKNAELKQHHLAARIGELQGSRVQAVRDVLDGMGAAGRNPAPHPVDADQAGHRAVHRRNQRHPRESYRDIPGIATEETP